MERQSLGQKIYLGKGPDDVIGAAAKESRFYICAVIKDEHSYIREWALHHREAGFDKIVLYDNNSSRPYDEELGDLRRNGFIEMREWPDTGQRRQLTAYNDFVRGGSWGENDYCAFIDVDEFIFFDGNKSVAEFMRYYKEFAGVGLSWRVYNASGRTEAPANVRTPQAYTSECEYFAPRIKVIGRLRDIAEFPTAHHFIPSRGRLVTTNCHTIYGMDADCIDFSNGHIKHYITKSWQDWVKRLRRGNITKGLRTVDTFFQFNPDMEYLKEELTKNLALDEFPTIRGGDSGWEEQ